MTSHGTSMTNNGGPPEAAACLYEGKVMHARMRPTEHRFSYNVFSILIDIDRLDEAGRMTPLLRVNRSGLLSFHEADHLEAGETSLRGQVDRQLRDAGVQAPAARIAIVCYPRLFGYVFNPLSVYYCWDGQDRLIALIYEVRNTFGGRHIYVCPVAEGELSDAGVHQTAAKIFHVSPFMEMDKTYHFRMLPPGRSVRWRILETGPEGPVLSATFSGECLALSTRSILGLLVRIPLMTFKVMAGIHYEAARLWWKKVPFFGMKPYYPEPATVLGNNHPETIAQTEKSTSLSNLAA